eukprot:TRINITY_DN552_c0_g3_i1.p1 TRINITY_DN552_c0_g3~~TRINITY_DN552_c0_g3_i1.p1  ORF type:complete len:534 (+),score=87.72 TRINITY_DN552_c0_g3_i1:100-1701(+)
MSDLFGLSPKIAEILRRDAFTFEELLNVDEVVSDTRNRNEELVNFLSKKPQVEKLITYLVSPASKEASEQVRVRYPVLCCEILGSEIDEIDNTIFQCPEFLDKLYGFFNSEELDPFHATIVCRVLGTYLITRPKETMSYVKSRKGFLKTFLKHLGNPSVSDFLIKMINTESQPGGEGTINWLVSEGLIPQIIDQFSSKNPSETHEHACQAVLDIISTISHESLLLKQIESEEMITKLLEYTLSGQGQHSALLHGTHVVIGLMNKLIDSEEEDENFELDPDNPPLFIRILLKYLPRYKQILYNPPSTRSLALPSGVTITTFGFHRLKVLELFLTLLSLGFNTVFKELLSLDIFQISLDLFFDYQWNNYLHRIVENMYLCVLKHDRWGAEVIKKTNLIKQICKADLKCKDITAKGNARLSYMGHLGNMALALKAAAKINVEIKQALENEPLWKEYNDTSLANKEFLLENPLGRVSPDNLNVLDPFAARQTDEDDDNEDMELDLDDDIDMESESDADDYDIDQAEVLLSKQEIELL